MQNINDLIKVVAKFVILYMLNLEKYSEKNYYYTGIPLL